MALEEKVIQTDSVNPPDQPVAETPSQPQAPNLDAIKAEYVGIEPPEVKISRDFDIERLIGQDITALTSLFDQQVIDREEFRDILVQGEVLPNANEVKSE